MAILKFSLGNSHSYENKFLLEFLMLKAGEALKERQCTLEGQAWYVTVQGSVHTLTIFMIDLNKVSVLIVINFYLSF